MNKIHFYVFFIFLLLFPQQTQNCTPTQVECQHDVSSVVEDGAQSLLTKNLLTFMRNTIAERREGCRKAHAFGPMANLMAYYQCKQFEKQGIKGLNNLLADTYKDRLWRCEKQGWIPSEMVQRYHEELQTDLLSPEKQSKPKPTPSNALTEATTPAYDCPPQINNQTWMWLALAFFCSTCALTVMLVLLCWKQKEGIHGNHSVHPKSPCDPLEQQHQNVQKGRNGGFGADQNGRYGVDQNGHSGAAQICCSAAGAGRNGRLVEPLSCSRGTFVEIPVNRIG